MDKSIMAYREKDKIVPGKEYVAADPGMVNPLTWTKAVRPQDPGGSLTASKKSFTVSTASYYHDTGIKPRVVESNLLKKTEEKQNPEFRNASAAVAVALTKTVNPAALLSALQTRGRCFRTMYAFYGQDDLARVRFTNYSSSLRFLEELKKKICPDKRFVLLVAVLLVNPVVWESKLIIEYKKIE
jgi:hypothetical protein